MQSIPIPQRSWQAAATVDDGPHDPAQMAAVTQFGAAPRELECGAAQGGARNKSVGACLPSFIFMSLARASSIWPCVPDGQEQLRCWNH